MTIEIASGLIKTALFRPSVNSDARSPDAQIELLVIHNISLPPGEYGGGYIEDFFLNQLKISDHEYFRTIADLRVSSHLLIKRTGKLVQFVPFHKRAWHAGVSCFEGRTACNDFSIGIELEGTDTAPYTAEQYHTLTEVTTALLGAYPRITLDRIVGHSDVAPGRKTDPGPAFQWQYYKTLLRSALGIST